MVYAVNDLTYTGTGNGEIDGAVFSRNIREYLVRRPSIQTRAANAAINYNCGYVRIPGGRDSRLTARRSRDLKTVADYSRSHSCS